MSRNRNTDSGSVCRPKPRQRRGLRRPRVGVGGLVLAVLVAGQLAAAQLAAESADVEPVAEQLLDPDDVYPVTSAQFRAILDHHRGKVVMVNIWTTWCKPCLHELPALDRLQQTYSERVKVLAVSLDDPKKLERMIRPFFKERAPNLVSYVAVGEPPERGRKGRGQRRRDSMAFMKDLWEDWPSRFPTTLYYNAEGKLRRTVVNSLTYDQFETVLKEVSGEAFAAAKLPGLAATVGRSSNGRTCGSGP